MKVFILVVVLLFVGCGWCDMYMQNPRGSNDRLNEANTNRNNANRLFDSQNNAKGGYCWGPSMSFYEGSQLTIEWTNQHGCANSKLYCNIVIQYMCTANDADPFIRIRDGQTTDTITDSPTGPNTTDTANGELLYGMHESYWSYQACKTRQRNMGLWIADRASEGGLTTGRPSSIFTRQNNNGDQYGYECPEERDYYPYWAPSAWKDIAILAASKDDCGYYQKHSQNKEARYQCNSTTGQLLSPISEAACTSQGGVWVKVPANGGGTPDCWDAPWSRDNHLGNGRGGYANTYNWTIPSSEKCISDNNCACVLRLRYNISTTDLNSAAQGNVDGNSPSGNFIDWKSNAANSPIYQDEVVNASGIAVQMAMDTTQFGRTFQDRSHVFQIRPRKGSNIPSIARVFNLNVRGKRGNIVEAYPATEYDFVPDVLYVRLGDYIHFQWTGCDTNPAGNAGEGTDQTDRSNIVQIEHFGANLPATDSWLKSHLKLFDSLATRQRMAFVDQDPTQCEDYATLLANNDNNEDNAKADVHNCMKLNAGEPYFDGGALRMNHTTDETTGFYYMSTRNNNFSNRGQKGVIYVLNLLPDWAIGLVSAGAALFVASGGIAGGMFYAKSHPHSKIAEIFSKF